MNYHPGNRPATSFIIRGILGEAEISNRSITSDVATSTEGQVSFVSKLANELKLMDDPATPSQLQLSALEVKQEDSKMSLEQKGKATTVSALEVMSTLSGKLATFMRGEQNKRKELRKQASFLEKELSTINASLEQLELMDELTPVVKNWRDDVREISYDMENCISDFKRQFGGEDAEASFNGEAVELQKRLCELHRISNQMEELRTLVVEAKGRRESYKIDDCKHSFDHVAVDHRLPAVYQEATNLVGIEGPRDEVANWLMGTQKKLKVVSIVGFGGLGKTTLAKQVYDKIRGQFNSVAFISVSQRPDTRVLLNRLQLKLRMESSHDRELDDIIEELREYLSKTRYLIVVDDLWDQSAWKTISCAFPENGNGSRIIVTTRVEDVASMACHNYRECIYTMKPLNEQNSKMLFSNRVFGSEVVCPPHLKEITVAILKKCGGLPLAIITIASLLATQARSWKHWESIRKSLGAQSATKPALKEMNSILNLSYSHLPLHLRACFLYLGMYPEDHIIWRDDLVKKWIAEGFVSCLHGLDLEDVGKSYFNELVNRSMIQPSETRYGEVLSCTVHDLMLDLILRKCIEDNFLSVAYNFEDMARLLHGCKYKVRRLSLSSMAVCGATYDTAISSSLSQVRSFILFKDRIPPLLWFKYLRVLSTEIWDDVIDLTAISHLCQLRYLMVRVGFRGKIVLPTELGELVYLETLGIGNSELVKSIYLGLHLLSRPYLVPLDYTDHLPQGIRNMKSHGLRLEKSIPTDIVYLPRLSYLVLPDYTDLPEGIGNVKSLRTLQGIGLEMSSLKFIMGIGELTNLRELCMGRLYDLEAPKTDALVCSIGKLHNLKCLTLSGLHFEHENNQLLGSLSNPFEYMEELRLSCWRFCRVPEWMGGLHCLRFLELYVKMASTEEVHILGELPSLVHLFFIAGAVPNERAILGTGLFPVLEFFYLLSWNDITAYLGFEAGAVPNLRTLCLNVNQWGGSIPAGMEDLLHLKEIRVHGPSNVESVFKEALLVHPNRPSFRWEAFNFLK
ncbi:hypothetical protein ACQJBY_061790 [Aegilops geniculata]